MRPVSKAAAGLVMAVSATVLIGLDLWTKALAASLLAGRGSVNLLGDFVVLVFTRNRGAFLSLGSGLPPALHSLLLIALPLAALGFFAWAFLWRGLGLRGGKQGETTGPGPREWVALVFIIAGGVGNLVDRVLYGEVRDFLNFGIGSLRTGIMNLADLYILAALIIIAVSIVAGRRR